MSKIIPYALLVLYGVLLLFQIKKTNFSRLLKFTICFLVLVLPFGIGFVLNPIYEGDFSKNGHEISKNNSPKEFTTDGLMIATIPDCPYCLGSISKLKLLKKRNPKLNIDFVVCTKNKEYIKRYKSEINGAFNLKIAQNADSLATTVGFKFPTFIQVKNKKPVYLWSNDEFGVRAIDDFEQLIK